MALRQDEAIPDIIYYLYTILWFKDILEVLGTSWYLARLPSAANVWEPDKVLYLFQLWYFIYSPISS